MFDDRRSIRGKWDLTGERSIMRVRRADDCMRSPGVVFAPFNCRDGIHAE
jgi:hypothetical protein